MKPPIHLPQTTTTIAILTTQRIRSITTSNTHTKNYVRSNGLVIRPILITIIIVATVVEHPMITIPVQTIVLVTIMKKEKMVLYKNSLKLSCSWLSKVELKRRFSKSITSWQKIWKMRPWIMDIDTFCWREIIVP